MTDLQLLFKEIDRVKNESDLRSHLAPKIGEYFTAKRSAIFFFDRCLDARSLAPVGGAGSHRLITNPKFQKILNVALSIEHNPVARYLAERHTPVHEAMVTSPKAWAIICPRPDHWHVMAGPIVNRGELVGVVGCTRERSMPAFNAENLADLSAICLHLSVWTATVTRPQYSNRTGLLTPRELEIAELVALGKTNAEIGSELWITTNTVKQALKRMFRKLEVSSRAEMVTQLFAMRQYSREN